MRLFYKFVILTFLLSGCAKTTGVNESLSDLNNNIDNTEHSVVDLQNNLPKNCLTDKIMIRFSDIEKNIQLLKSTAKEISLNYNLEVSKYKHTNERKSFIIFLLLSIICFYTYKKIKRGII